MTVQPESEKKLTEAERRKQEAEERKQEAEADQAAETVEETRQKTEKLRIENEKLKAELEEWKERESERTAEARAKQEEARAKQDEARGKQEELQQMIEGLRLKNQESERAALKDLVPDLTGVDRGSTTAETTLFDALLNGRALDDAARKVAVQVTGHFRNAAQPVKIVVTTDLDLAARDARYLAVREHLKQLELEVVTVLGQRPGQRQLLAPSGLGAVAVGLAKLLPGLLSLVSAKRVLKTSTSTPDADIVLMAVAGAIAPSEKVTPVVVEKTRLLTESGAVGTAWNEYEYALRRLEEAIAEEKTAQSESKQEGEDPRKSWLESATTTLTAGRAAASALTALPEGGSLSLLAQASLQEVLHDEKLGGLLVLKAGTASATQLIDDRPLLFDDPLSVVSTATIAYLLISPTEGSRVLAGGLAHGIAQLTGSIGSRLDVVIGSPDGESTNPQLKYIP